MADGWGKLTTPLRQGRFLVACATIEAERGIRAALWA